MRYYAIYTLIVAVAGAFNLAARRYRLRAPAWWAGNAMLAALMAALMWSVSEPLNFLSDFEKAYYPAGHLVTGEPDRLYADTGADGFVNVPIVAWIFVPFSWMGSDAAGSLMTALGVCVIAASFVGLTMLADLRGWQRAALAAIFVVNGPLYNSLREGNLTHFILGLLLAALWCMETRRDGWLGAILAVVAVVKPPLLLLAVPFLLRRNPRFAAGFGAVIACVAVVSIAAFGIDLHVTWYERTVEPFTRHPLGAFNVQSIDGFLARPLGGSENLRNWQPLEQFGAGFFTARVALAMTMCGATAWIFLRSRRPARPEDLRLEFVTMLCLALVLGPISWTHYYLLVLLAAALFLGGRLAVPSGARWAAAVWLGFALVSPPVIVANTEHAVVGPLIARLLLSHYFAGGVVLLGVFLAARWEMSRRPDRDVAYAEREPQAA